MNAVEYFRGRKEKRMRSKSEAIAGIALIMLASIMAGTTAVGATSEGPLSTGDCPICPDSRMELYSSFRAWALVCDYRNSVDINNCGNIAIWPYDSAGDAQKRFKDMRTYKKELNDCEILREEDDEIVVIINQNKVSDPNYHYSVSGVFLDICSEKSYITEVRVKTATKDKITTIRWFNALAECAKRVVDKKCGEKLSRVEIEQVPKHVVKDVSANFTVYAYDSRGCPTITQQPQIASHLHSTKRII